MMLLKEFKELSLASLVVCYYITPCIGRNKLILVYNLSLWITQLGYGINQLVCRLVISQKKYSYSPNPSTSISTEHGFGGVLSTSQTQNLKQANIFLNGKNVQTWYPSCASLLAIPPPLVLLSTPQPLPSYLSSMSFMTNYLIHQLIMVQNNWMNFGTNCTQSVVKTIENQRQINLEKTFLLHQYSSNGQIAQNGRTS